jgi:signal transduction histidine kinase
MQPLQNHSLQKRNSHLDEDARFRILNEVIQQLISILDITELLAQVVRLIQKTFDCYHAGIGLIEGDEVVYRVGAGELWENPEFQFEPPRLKVGLQGITGWVAQSGEPALVLDVSQDSHYVWMEGSLTRSELTVPIPAKGRVIGVLDCQSQRVAGFTPSDLELLQAIAGQTGIAIENARLFAETQRLLKETEQRASELALINRVQQDLSSKLDVQSIYDLVGETFRHIFNAQVVMISSYDEQSDTVVHRYAIERGRRVYSPGRHPPGGFRSRIIQTKQPLLINTNVAEEAVLLLQPVLPGTDPPKSWLGVPMLVDGQVTGILSVQNVDRENAFNESDIRLLQTFAAAMSIALENARLYEDAKKMAALEERQRLSRELHDSVTQSLYGICLYAQAASGKLDREEIGQARRYINDIQNTAQESLADMRLLIYELRPPILEQEGLVAAIQNRLMSVEDRAGIMCSVSSDLTGRLSFETEEGLYGIVREALNNVIKHAHARNISIRMEENHEAFCMEISDDGIGFVPAAACRQGCLGIASMQERARSRGWQFRLTSSPGNGTCIQVEVNRQ